MSIIKSWATSLALIILLSSNVFAESSNIHIYQYYKDSQNTYHMFGRVYKNTFTNKGLSAGFKALLKKKLKKIPLEIEIFDKKLYTKTNNIGFFKVRFRENNLNRVSEKTIVSIKPNLHDHQGQIEIFPTNYGPNQKIGIISDIDDTVMVTECRSKTRMVINTFFKSARKREVVVGKSQLYRAILDSNPQIPLIFLSSSPIHLFHYLSSFLALHNFPKYIMKLKVLTLNSLFSKNNTKNLQMLGDFCIEGIEGIEVKPDSLHGHLDYKVNKILSILKEFPNQKFILFGDSGESDPEIYSKVIHTVPDRIINAFIRDITNETERFNKINNELQKINRSMIFSENEVEPARYCYENGFISNEKLSQIEKLFSKNVSEKEKYSKINQNLLNLSTMVRQIKSADYSDGLRRKYDNQLKKFKDIISLHKITPEDLIKYNQEHFPEMKKIPFFDIYYIFRSCR